MKLIPIEDRSDAAHILWDLLAERPANANISHREMPTWDAHVAFVRNNPYAFWGLIETMHGIVGAIYLSKPGGPSVPGNEIGIDIFSWAQGQGHGTEAVKLLMEMHGDRRYIANVSPRNEASQALFKSLGFRLCQFTFAKEDV